MLLFVYHSPCAWVRDGLSNVNYISLICGHISLWFPRHRSGSFYPLAWITPFSPTLSVPKHTDTLFFTVVCRFESCLSLVSFVELLIQILATLQHPLVKKESHCSGMFTFIACPVSPFIFYYFPKPSTVLLLYLTYLSERLHPYILSWALKSSTQQTIGDGWQVL